MNKLIDELKFDNRNLIFENKILKETIQKFGRIKKFSKISIDNSTSKNFKINPSDIIQEERISDIKENPNSNKEKKYVKKNTIETIETINEIKENTTLLRQSKELKNIKYFKLIFKGTDEDLFSKKKIKFFENFFVIGTNSKNVDINEKKLK